MHDHIRTVCIAILSNWTLTVFSTPTQPIYLSTFPTVRAAFDAAAEGGTVIVDVDRAADTATGTLRGRWNNLTICGTNGHRISGSVVFDGQAVKMGTTAYTNRANCWLPVGTTNLTLSPTPPTNQPLVMATTQERAYINQCGIEFIRASRIQGDRIALDADLSQPGQQGLRTAFFNPIVRTCEGYAFTGTLARGATLLPGAEWQKRFRPGDIVRIENISGTDSVEHDTHYFENVEIQTANDTGLTFAPLASSFGTPFIVQTDFGQNLTIRNAVFENLTIASYNNVTIQSLETERIRLINCYDFDVQNIVAVSAKGYSTLAGFTFCKIGRVENIFASGGSSSADNANIKFMSPIHVVARNLMSADSRGLRNDQAMCGIFVDYCYSPYVTWSTDNTFANLVSKKPDGGAPVSIWFTGIRDSTIANMNGGDGDVRLHKTDHVQVTGASNRCDRIMDYFETRASIFDFGTSAYVRIASCKDSAFTGCVTGGDGTLQHDGRNVWVSGTTHAACENLRLHDIVSTSPHASPFIWLQNVDQIRIENCSDQPRDTTASSLHRGNHVSNVILSNNTFRVRH